MSQYHEGLLIGLTLGIVIGINILNVLIMLTESKRQTMKEISPEQSKGMMKCTCRTPSRSDESVKILFGYYPCKLGITVTKCVRCSNWLLPEPLK